MSRCLLWLCLHPQDPRVLCLGHAQHVLRPCSRSAVPANPCPHLPVAPRTLCRSRTLLSLLLHGKQKKKLKGLAAIWNSRQTSHTSKPIILAASSPGWPPSRAKCSLHRSSATTNQCIAFDIEVQGRHLATGGQVGSPPSWYTQGVHMCCCHSAAPCHPCSAPAEPGGPWA